MFTHSTQPNVRLLFSCLRLVQTSRRDRAIRLRALRLLCAVLIILAAKSSGQELRAAPNSAHHYDVVVYGGTSAGIVAAIQVKRMGRTVILLEPSSHLGGLTTSGLGFTDSGDKRVIGGVAREFYQRIKQAYLSDEAWKFESRSDYRYFDADSDAMWRFEPSVAMAVFKAWLNEEKVPYRLNEPLDRNSGVKRTGTQVTSIASRSGTVYHARRFIDATYEGDLMAAAGVSFTTGRESNDRYGETLNGVQKKQNLYNHRFLKPVDPYRVPADPTSGVIWGVHNGPPGEEGSGDDRVQAYCYRMCMTQVQENLAPFPKPSDYDESKYEVMFRVFEAGDLRMPFSPDLMPNGKTDTNNLGAMSTDAIGLADDYPEASYEERERIVTEHRSYQQGLMWTLANHPRVPEQIRDKMATWGLAADEFTETEHWPPMLYIREGRRMVGAYVMTEHDCRRTRKVADSIGLGSYNMDSHNVQRYINEQGFLANEGDVQVSPGGAYLISYHAIVPKPGEVSNLLVPVGLSASHIAYGSIRMEPVFMILGQSAATAAVLSMDANLSVQDLPYATLERQLKADGQVLELP